MKKIYTLILTACSLTACNNLLDEIPDNQVRIDTPEKAKRVIELGAFSVVVGSIITRPQIITKHFAEALK